MNADHPPQAIRDEPLVFTLEGTVKRHHLVHVELEGRLRTPYFDGQEFVYPLGIAAELETHGYTDRTHHYAEALGTAGICLPACGHGAVSEPDCPQFRWLEAGWWDHVHRPAESPFTESPVRASAKGNDPGRTPFSEQYVLTYRQVDPCRDYVLTASPRTGHTPPHPAALLDLVFAPSLQLYFSAPASVAVVRYDGSLDCYRRPVERRYTARTGWTQRGSQTIIGDFSAAIRRFCYHQTAVPAVPRPTPDYWIGDGDIPITPPPFG